MGIRTEKYNSRKVFDGLYGNQIEITSFKFEGRKYECKVRFTYYDVFGLESDDIETNGAGGVKFGEKEGFRILIYYV